MYHYFYLVREMPKDIYGMDVDYIKLVKIDDDIIRKRPAASST